jgi:hypothetical protein
VSDLEFILYMIVWACLMAINWEQTRIQEVPCNFCFRYARRMDMMNAGDGDRMCPHCKNELIESIERSKDPENLISLDEMLAKYDVTD